MVGARGLGDALAHALGLTGRSGRSLGGRALMPLLRARTPGGGRALLRAGAGAGTRLSLRARARGGVVAVQPRAGALLRGQRRLDVLGGVQPVALRVVEGAAWG